MEFQSDPLGSRKKSQSSRPGMAGSSLLPVPRRNRLYATACAAEHHRSRICFKGQKVNLSQVFADQNVAVTQVGERTWLISPM